MEHNDYITLSWNDLEAEARERLKSGDLEALREMDAAFHYFFVNELRRGDEASRTEFIMGVLGVLESPEFREVTEAAELQQILCRWKHLDELMDALRQDGDLIDEAERLVQSRKHAEQMLALLASVSEEGMKAGELASKLGISPQHLAKLLRELQSQDIIERHSAGKQVYVCLGLAGHLLVKRRSERQAEAAVSRSAIQSEESMVEAGSLFGEDSQVYQPIASPLEWLAFVN